MQWLLWLVTLLGLWLIIAPFTLGYSATASAMWNEIIVGIVVAACAGWAAWTQRSTQKV
ncbi:MAG: SPW repeat protein [Chloroflexota bacterium]